MPKKKKSHPKSTKNRTIKKLVFFFIAVVFAVGLFSFTFKYVKFASAPCANSISCIKDLTSKYEPNAKGVYLGQALKAPKFFAQAPTARQVLGQTNEAKHIYVDLTNQMLYAFQDEKLLYSFPVSTGKWNHTPTGDFKIWIKLISTRMSGGSGADYYNLPNVPYTMFYYNNKVSKGQGYSIHGAYWHNNFGYPMSHGCVNMRPEDAEKIYNWADPVATGNTTHATVDNPGTIVTVYGETPAV